MNNHKTSTVISPPYTLAYTVILLIAVGLRFALLGSHPLNDHEAKLALQALALGRGQDVLLAGEPGYLALTAANFFVFGASNFMARAWPALIGSLAVLLPLLFRPWLGRETSLLLAFFIAMDPILIGTSRIADGSALAMVGLISGTGFLIMKKPVLSGMCLGAALTGGPQIWIGVLMLTVFVTIGRQTLARLSILSTGGWTKREWMTTAITTAVTLIVISTLFFTNPVGISAVGSSLADFFASLGDIGGAQLPAMGAGWLWMELPVFVLAMWALVDGLLRKDEVTRLLGLWWGLALVLALVTSMNGVDHFYWLAFPLLGLAAKQTGALFRQRSIENRLVFISELVLVVALTVFSIMNLMALVNNVYLTAEETRNRIIGTLLPIILLIVLTILLSWGWSTSSARKGFIAGMLVLFTLVGLSNSWKAAGLGSRTQYELGIYEGYPIGQAPLMATITDISRWNTGYEKRIDILLVGVDIPSLEWALRDFERLSKESGYNPNLSPSLILTGIDQNISSSASYRGQKFLWTVKPDLAVMQFNDWIKWAFFRTAPVEQTELILWARNDLFPGNATP